MARKKPYAKRPPRVITFEDGKKSDHKNIADLDDIATLRPTKKGQNAAKKISKKYKKLRNKEPSRTLTTDDIDLKITDSRVVNDEADIDFNITDSRAVDNDPDINFNITESKVGVSKNKNMRAAAAKNKSKVQKN